MRVWWIAIVVIGLGVRVRADGRSTTARHLLAGVRAFKEGRYEEAVVELRVVQRAPDAPADLAFYLGPTLVQLGRDREAIDVFLVSKAPPDALTDFYLGEAYYHLKLYRKARAVFAALRSHGLGPALDQVAALYIERVDAAYAKPASDATIDYYVDHAHEASGDALFAAELIDEAHQVEALSPAHHRHAEIVAALGAAWNGIGRVQDVIHVLGAEPEPSADMRWQLARAYAIAGDAAHARPLLDALVAANGPWVSDAIALRATLPPP
jgi:tetratricopeptide (TPR) repeat protein